MLVVHRAERATALVDGLADLVADPLPDPFAAELVAVPARGVERWLAQRLSHRLGTGVGTSGAPRADGVCANVAFPSPRRMLDGVVAAAAPEAAAALALWDPERLAWPLLELLDGVVHEDWCAVPRRHLFVAGDPAGTPTGRRLSLATHVARLFDGYARSRPELLERWAAGETVLPHAGAWVPVDPHEQWQPRLWRLLLDRLGGTSPVRLRQQVCAAVREHPERVSAPPRLSVFGASRLPRTDLDLLAALAEGRDVHLWLHHASPALWDAVAAQEPVVRRGDDRTTVTNPLLRSLSRDVRELQHLIRAHAPGATSVHHAATVGHDTSGGRATDTAGTDAATLLERLRADLVADRVPSTPVPLATGDRSVQVHACHGRTRQVEVLREVVVGLLADDPTLEARDVLVMCPDVEAFAPLLAATFATRAEQDEPPSPRADDAHPAARLRVRVADRALHQSNPLVAVLDRLLELAAGRCTAGEVLDLAGHPAVARRFGLDDDAVERLRDWVGAAGIRWGLDREHRAAWQLQQVPDGTWRGGVDRLLLGAAVEPGRGADAGPVAGLVPVDDVDSADLDLLGRLAELVDRLDAVHDDLSGRHSPAVWADLLERATLRLAAPERDGAWQELQLRDVLAEALLPGHDDLDLADGGPAGDAGDAGGAPLTLAELRPVLRDALAGRPTRTGFRTGALTVCTLVPMRSVPHRVVVLLGLDDGAFPRQTVRDGDDLLARDPWVGDRDPRSEDRQLLLDAVGAAGEHLVVTYTGHDERTGAPVPPAVPLGELLDAVDRTVVGPDGRPGRDAVTTHHPLQPFDPRSFTPGALGTDPAGRPFGFDPRAYCGAVAATGERRPPPPVLPGPLPAPPLADVALDDVVRLLVHPAKQFLRQRLQLSLTERDDDPDDALPVQLDGLGRWGVGDRLLRDRLSGLDVPTVAALERGRGELPPGGLGARVLADVGRQVEALVQATEPWHATEPESYDLSIDLGDGTQLTGTVGGVRGDCLVSVAFSSLAAKHRLTAWVRLLALTACLPERGWQAVTLGRGTGRDKARCARSLLGPVEPARATAALRDLVALFRTGLAEPLPLPCATAGAYAGRRHEGKRVSIARNVANQRWADSDNGYGGEQSEPEHVLVHGGVVPLDGLLAARARAGDAGTLVPHLAADEEGDRFGVLARRLWTPLLEAETRDVL